MNKSPKSPPDKLFVPAKMTNWFHPAMLLNAAIKAIVAGTFGNYADRREIQAALHNNAEEQKEADDLNINYSTREDIWVDFISDTGDGFNSTYSVALTAAQEELIVDVKGEKRKLPRGKIVCFGGDQIYPTPSADAYEQKFRVPFRAANPLVENEDENQRPHLYAIPGNHDWYDGLGNFIKIFCQGRWIGNWMTKQHRSYFALQLPYRHWIWATDIQLNADIDQPQLDYFLNLAKSDRMKSGDKIILITAEPSWVYKQLYVNDKSYDRLKYFTEVYITDDKYGWVGKKFDLPLVLTGDLHHYSHYYSELTDEMKQQHFITAGGGGAFMHLTHNLPLTLPKLDEQAGDPEDLNEEYTSQRKKPMNLQQHTVFPTQQESQKLVMGNLIFPLKNFSFAILIGCFYFLIAWLSQSLLHMLKENFSLEDAVLNLHNFRQLMEVKKLFLDAPPVIILSLIFFLGILFFTDTQSGKKGIILIGLLHAIVQITVLFSLLWLFAMINLRVLGMNSENIFQSILYILECIFIGGIVGSFIMGFYLWFCNRFLNIHLDEASSSLKEEDFKNFLRIHVSRDGVTVYPIGIRSVIKNWKSQGSGEKLKFTSQPIAGKIPECHLIESSPIFIKNQQQ